MSISLHINKGGGFDRSQLSRKEASRQPFISQINPTAQTSGWDRWAAAACCKGTPEEMGKARSTSVGRLSCEVT